MSDERSQVQVHRLSVVRFAPDPVVWQEKYRRISE